MNRESVNTDKVSPDRKLAGAKVKRATARHTSGFPDSETEIGRHYSAIRAGIADGMPITLLHIGAEQTLVASGSGTEPEAILTLAIGARKTAAEHFKHQPPTPGELENAILTVEDEVVRARSLSKDGSALFSTDAAIREIALLAGVPDRPELILGLEAMERIFGRLTTITLGRPAAQEGLPSSAAFAATLLILREFMHHLKFSSITVTA
jgi:exopolyphosphatase/pppGpp-phosphohydrolase